MNESRCDERQKGRVERAHDPDTMVAPLTPKPTRKVETLARAPPTIASRLEEDAGIKRTKRTRKLKG
jgi:hypothetical protein